MRVLKKAVMALSIGLSLLAVAGCGAIPGNPQGYAGITKATVDFEDGKLVRAIIWDGKEKQDVALDVDLNAGTAHYSASGSQAFQGQALRAQVESAVAEKLADAAPEVVASVVDAVMEAVSGGAAQ
jgi:hypothetical protein